MCPSDGAGDGAQAWVGFAAPGKSLVEDEHLVGFAVPLPEELRTFAKATSLGLRSGPICAIGFSQEAQRLGVEAAEGLRLDRISSGADEELTASMAWRLGTPKGTPLLFQLATRAIGQGVDPCGN
jgi:hypothetical protein